MQSLQCSDMIMTCTMDLDEALHPTMPSVGKLHQEVMWPDICLSVGLSVCLLATLLKTTGWILHENFMKDVSWTRKNCLNIGSHPGKSSESVQWTCWRPVTHAQTWTSYSAVYWFGSLSVIHFWTWRYANWKTSTLLHCLFTFANGRTSYSTGS